MKKIIFIACLVSGILILSQADAQTKIGYVNIDEVVSLMHISQDSMNASVQKFLTDSVQPQIDYLQSEYNTKYNRLISDTTLSDVVRKTILGEVQNLERQLQGVESAVQQIRQSKQQEYLQPYYQKAANAVRDVAKTNGYTYILNKQIVIVGPPTDDLLPLVVKKLGLEMPAPK